MANRYKNANFDLTTTDATDIYTVPSESRAIIQNIHTANVGSGNVEIKAFVFDTSAGRAYQYQNLTEHRRKMQVIKPEKIIEKITNLKTGEEYKDDNEWKSKGIPEEDIRRDIKVLMPSLDIFGKTK